MRIACVTGVLAALAGACGGSTGREGAPPAGTEMADATSEDDPFRLDAGSFDVTIGYFDQILPDVMPPPGAAEGGGGGGGGASGPTGCAPSLPFDDAGNLVALLSDGGPGDFANVASWAPAEYAGDGGVEVAPEGGICDRELARVQKYDPNLPVTPTELQFFGKDVQNGDTGDDGGTGFTCGSCMLFNDCLDNQVDGITGVECEDIPGVAKGGAKVGTSRAVLCEAVLSCIFSTAPTCATKGDSSICYCGAANAGNACQMIAQGTGPCAQQEADALEFTITDPVDILSNFTDSARGGGTANSFFECGQANGCSTCWQ